MDNAQISRAVVEYIRRRDRLAHPSGKFDKARRWYPSDDETCECCAAIRSPSRAYPYSYMTHCRSIAHVASLYRVDPRALRRAVRLAETAA